MRELSGVLTQPPVGPVTDQRPTARSRPAHGGNHQVPRHHCRSGDAGRVLGRPWAVRADEPIRGADAKPPARTDVPLPTNSASLAHQSGGPRPRYFAEAAGAHRAPARLGLRLGVRTGWQVATPAASSGTLKVMSRGGSVVASPMVVFPPSRDYKDAARSARAWGCSRRTVYCVPVVVRHILIRGQSALPRSTEVQCGVPLLFRTPDLRRRWSPERSPHAGTQEPGVPSTSC